MDYAVVALAGKQYLVKAGQFLTVDQLKLDSNDEIKIDQVLLLVSDGKVYLGKPTVPAAVVSAKIVANRAGKKIDVVKFKPKSRYRRKFGFRPKLTELLIEKIELKKSTKN